MIRRPIPLLACLFVLALGTASAGFAPCEASPEVTTPETGVSYASLFTNQDGTGTYYVDNDFCQPFDCLLSFWIYEESNGVPGLQRGDEAADPSPWCGPFDTPVF